MSKRRRAREMAVQMLYQCDLGSAPPALVLRSFHPADYGSELAAGDGGAPRADADAAAATRRRDGEEQSVEYARILVEGVLEHLQEIDGLIGRQAENWRLERMPVVDRNVLRLAVFEFLYETDVPKLVVLDEAIELAKKFGSEQSGRFVNGVLDGLLKSRSFPGSLT